MKFPTWGDLIDNHCHREWVKIDGKDAPNPYYEYLANRRYNFSATQDETQFRFVFLKSILKNPESKTLVRKGRFIWCSSLKYEGLHHDGFRQISFTVDRGSKRFVASERDVLCVPSDNFINNNRVYGGKQKVFRGFSSVFSYKNTLDAMARSGNIPTDELLRATELDNPYKPGTLVIPRLGYFYPVAQPNQKIDQRQEYPCGIILGRSLSSDRVHGREFYRVRFASTTQEAVHPVQLEIVR